MMLPFVQVERVVSFIPPDGHFRLLSYQIGAQQLVPITEALILSLIPPPPILHAHTHTRNNIITTPCSMVALPV